MAQAYHEVSTYTHTHTFTRLVRTRHQLLRSFTVCLQKQARPYIGGGAVLRSLLVGVRGSRLLWVWTARVVGRGRVVIHGRSARRKAHWESREIVDQVSRHVSPNMEMCANYFRLICFFSAVFKLVCPARPNFSSQRKIGSS